ncbi:UDP-N-acetylmuramoyl-tripeptide--D-alanyl-D-alanine ligase [Oleiharenicola lentus]|uniref:UDP-N-acetylmuramoyl-tripeptide--D-alanyl-D- alanine ligase n=1 Tax=Oleiharenicola lentus TaxID=2508720 RepID=UPI003F67720B
MPTFTAEKMAAGTGGRWNRFPSGAVAGFTNDTRQLAAGQVFVALKTDKRDGHDFLAQAQQSGATAALVSREVDDVNLPQLVVGDTLEAFQRIARDHRREFPGTVVGISGSVGKTSTKDLLSVLLGGAPEVLATAGNLNNFIGVPLTLTKLDAATHRAAVVEAGISVPGEMVSLAAMIEPDHSIITLVAPAHLEQLGSLGGVAFEKSRLPAANRGGGLAVFPVSCWQFECFRELANPLVLVPENEIAMQPASGRAIKFSFAQRAENSELTLNGKRRFSLSRRVSAGMVQNAALALVLASELGVSDETLQTRLAHWQPSKWRGELQRVGDALVYCDFYNANPASMMDAIAAFTASVKEELPRLYILGSMEELGADSAAFHRQVGRSLHLRSGDFIFLIGSQAEALRVGVLENGNDFSQIAVLNDLQPARDRLAHFKGAVFVKGSRRYQLETVLDPHAVAHA